MQHNVSEPLGLLLKLDEQYLALIRDGTGLEEIQSRRAEMREFYRSLRRLNELRAENGFDETVNRAYGVFLVGYFTAYLYRVHQRVRPFVESVGKYRLPIARELKSLMFDGPALSLLQGLREECESTGLNQAIDFDKSG